MKLTHTDLLAAMKIAADIQHETSSMRGEIDCTEETPCIFCALIAKAEPADPRELGVDRGQASIYAVWSIAVAALIVLAATAPVGKVIDALLRAIGY